MGAPLAGRLSAPEDLGVREAEEKKMSDPVTEMFEFAGKACGIVVKDLADVSHPLAEAFRRGWRQAMAERATREPEAAKPAEAPESP